MGEIAEKKGATPGIVGHPQEEIESLTGKGAKEGIFPWIPQEWKRRVIGIVAGLGATGLMGALIWEATHPPAITEPASAAQIPQPELVIPREKERVSEESQVDIPSTEIPEEWQSLIGKEAEGEVKEPTIYTVQEGDTLTKIAQEHGSIPWEIIYNMNKDVIGEDPDLIKPGQELLIIHWGPVETSQDLVYDKLIEAYEKGEEITWVNFALGREATPLQVAEFFGIDVRDLLELNEIDEETKPLPKNYYLMIPIGEGFAFTQADQEAGRKWVPIPGIGLDAIWWENPTGEATAGPWWPNEAFILEPYAKEYWVEATWSTADELPPEDFIPEIVTDTPANRTWEITDEKGNVTYEEREGFLVHGKKRIVHTEYRKAEAGEWAIPAPTA